MEKKSKSQLANVIITALSFMINHLVNIFFPTNVTLFIEKLLTYSLDSIFKYWYITGSLVLALLACKKKLGKKAMITLLVVILTLPFFIASYRDLFTPTPLETIAFAGCYTTNNIGVLDRNPESKFIESLLASKIKSAMKEHEFFNSNFIEIDFYEQPIPSFLLPLFGVNGFRDFIKWKMGKNYASCLYLVRNLLDNRIQVVFEINNKVFGSYNLLTRDVVNFSLLSNDPNVNINDLIEMLGDYFVAVMGQSYLDIIITRGKYDLANHIINDTGKKITKVFHSVDPSYECNQRNLRKMLNSWMAHLERERSLIHQENLRYYEAFHHLFKSIEYDPYFPYETCEEFKEQYTKSHILKVKKEEFSPDLKVIPTYDLLLNLIRDVTMGGNLSRLIIGLIEENAALLGEKNEPMFKLFASDILKYLPQGELKINKIYLDRFPTCKTYLEQATKLDPYFDIAYIKLASLVQLEGIVEDDFSKIDESYKLLKKGINAYYQYGRDDMEELSIREIYDYLKQLEITAVEPLGKQLH